MLIKEKLRFNGNDMNLKLNLGSNNLVGGFQDPINDYVATETNSAINDITDGDKTKFKPITEYIYNFKFSPSFITLYGLVAAGLSSIEIANREEKVLRCFYIMQIYDSVNEEKQELLHTGYYNGFNFITIFESNTSYDLLTEEFTNLYMPNSFLNSITGDTETIYAKFLFYNTSSADQLQPFYKEENEALLSDDKQYHEIEINKTTKTYSYVSGNQINCKEDLNTSYVNKINSTLSSFNIEKPTFPTGDTFNSDGTYSSYSETVAAIPTTEPPPPPTYYMHFRADTPNATACSVCPANIGIFILYTHPNVSIPVNEIVFYQDSDLTMVHNGGDMWWKIEWAGPSSSTTDMVKIDSNGVVTDTDICSVACP